MKKPFQLLPVFRERVWGRESLAPWFGVTSRPQQRIGEVWFTSGENATSLGSTLEQLLSRHPEILGTAADPQHPGICPLLLKLLFTSARLSVQVHPDDAYAEQHHQSLGKTEAWYVLESQPPGELAVGFRQPIASDRLKRAAQSGEIERLLNWRKVGRGEVIFIPAGTVHALGAGLTIYEIQENSDITYRLYDYGRPRELHLEHGVAVADLEPHASTPERTTLGKRREQLLACPYFRMERLRSVKRIQFPAGLPHYLLLMCVGGAGEIASEAFRMGQAWMAPARGEEFTVEGSDAEWIVAYTAEEPLAGITA